MDTQIYEMSCLEKDECDNPFGSVSFFLALSSESRVISAYQRLKEMDTDIKHVIAIRYNQAQIPNDISQDFSPDVFHIIDVNGYDEPYLFLTKIKDVSQEIWESKTIIIDISCLRVLEMFSLIKLVNSKGNDDIFIVYSLPYDYSASGFPFTSYKSYTGDLKMYEPIGFGGSGNNDNGLTLYIFMGFDAALGEKVIENCDYTNLVLINNLPSYYLKYKDITVVNNYELMSRPHDYMFVPADNPFETYNLLESVTSGNDSSICIAPLGTKPVALGVCLYAIDNDKVRIVFPAAEKNNPYSVDTYKTLLYHIYFGRESNTTG